MYISHILLLILYCFLLLLSLLLLLFGSKARWLYNINSLGHSDFWGKL